MKVTLTILICLLGFSDVFAEKCKGLTTDIGSLIGVCSHKNITMSEPAGFFSGLSDSKRKKQCLALVEEKGKKESAAWAKENCIGGTANAQIKFYTGSEIDPNSGLCDFFGTDELIFETSISCLKGKKTSPEAEKKCKQIYKDLKLDYSHSPFSGNDEPTIIVENDDWLATNVTPAACRKRHQMLFDKIEDLDTSRYYSYEIYDLENELGLNSGSYENSSAKTIDELIAKIDKLNKQLLNSVGESSKVEKMRQVEKIKRDEKLARLAQLKEKAEKDKSLLKKMKTSILTPECTVTIRDFTRHYHGTGESCVCKGTICNLIEDGFTNDSINNSRNASETIKQTTENNSTVD